MFKVIARIAWLALITTSGVLLYEELVGGGSNRRMFGYALFVCVGIVALVTSMLSTKNAKID